MIGQENRNEDTSRAQKIPEAWYSYYRRCQVFRRNGEQCKAPAEKGAHICYAHAREQATAFRRKLQLTVLLAEVVRRMRQRGKPEFKVADIFMDFNAIQVTLAVMAQAVIDGTIDCKTAGRLAIGLQTAAKVLRMIHRQGREVRKGQEIRPQICAARPSRNQKETSTTETRKHREPGMRRLEGGNSSRHGTNTIVSSTDERISGKGLTTKNPTPNGDVGRDELSQVVARNKYSEHVMEERKIARIIPLRTVAVHAGTAHAPPAQARAA